MKIFVNQDIRRLFLAAALALFLAAAAGLLLVRLAAEDYKNALIAQSVGLAGALAEQGLDPAAVTALLTAPKTEAQQAAGRRVLEQAGVTAGLDYRLLPETSRFMRRYGAAALALAAVFSAAALGGLYRFFARQEGQIEQATRAIEQFIQSGEQAGASGAIFPPAGGSLGEGSLAQLFGAVNGMAAALTAHIQREQHGREFLKDTISNISHQLKTPLAALHMYTEIIRGEDPANPVIAEFILKSERELGRMEYLIQNLLKLARLDAGAIILEKRRLDLPSFLKETLDCFAVRAGVESKTIELRCPDGLALDGDEHWLAEAVSSVVKNAFDHTQAGGRVQVICEETPLMVTITVQDNGSGIHPDDLPHVFKRFYRSRYSQDHQGVGIGLTLARGIVERHGGTMAAESEPGQGAAFRMIFPKLTNL